MWKRKKNKDVKGRRYYAQALIDSLERERLEAVKEEAEAAAMARQTFTHTSYGPGTWMGREGNETLGEWVEKRDAERIAAENAKAVEIFRGKGPDGAGEDWATLPAKVTITGPATSTIGTSDFSTAQADISNIGPSSFVTVPSQSWPWSTIRNAETVKPPDPLPKELVAGPIVAYRVWGFSLGLGTLYPTASKDFWPYLPEKAICSIGSGVCQGFGEGEGKSSGVPRAGCTCGWHAARDMDYLHENFQGVGEQVMGEVALWGKVISHEKGYRAQYAHPLRIWLKGAPDIPGFPVGQAIQDELKLIGGRYGCEVLEGPPE